MGEGSAEFAQALRALRLVRLRPEIRLSEAPAPQRIAPYAVALTAEVVASGVDDDELASGRFVLLYDPAAPEPWDGVWRAVTFARAELEPELASDPMLGAVGWSWLTDALDEHGAAHVNEAGTVTRVVSESFAALSDRSATVEMEVRASWTPTTVGPTLGVRGGGPAGPDTSGTAASGGAGAARAAGGGAVAMVDLGRHLQAWADLLCTIAGLPPLPEGVTPLPSPRR